MYSSDRGYQKCYMYGKNITLPKVVFKTLTIREPLYFINIYKPDFGDAHFDFERLKNTFN